MAGPSEDDAFETWRRWRFDQGETVTVIELYELVAGSRGLRAEQLSVEERRTLAARALEVMYTGFQLGPSSERSEVEPIELMPYDSSWQAQFEGWKKRLLDALHKAARRIDHVGSTAVDGLPAKPVIDIQISVDDLNDELNYLPPIERLGVQFRSRDDESRYFRPFSGRPRDVHIHVCATGSEWERRHLLFRDYLRADASARQTYLQTKQLAAARWSDDRLAYTDAKGATIRFLMTSAERWATSTGWNVTGS